MAIPFVFNLYSITLKNIIIQILQNIMSGHINMSSDMNTFRDCTSKRLKPLVEYATRERGGKIRCMPNTFGNDPHQVIGYLKQRGLCITNL